MRRTTGPMTRPSPEEDAPLFEGLALLAEALAPPALRLGRLLDRLGEAG